MDEEFQFKKIKLPRKKPSPPGSPILDHLQKKPASKTVPVSPNPSTSKSTVSSKASDPETMKTKLSTAIMVNQALEDLKSRKGCSLHAIKKYMGEKYNVDPEKIGSLVKRYLKTAVEKGQIVQTKGVGATGSFKLDPKAQKPKKTEKKKMEKKTDDDTKKAKPKEKEKKEIEKVKKPLPKKESNKEIKEKVEKKNKAKFQKNLKSPKKTTKGPQARRKSLGSIVKPPQMKPKTPKKPTNRKQKAV